MELIERLVERDATTAASLAAEAEEALRAETEGRGVPAETVQRTQARLLDARGRALEILGRPGEAADAFRAALARDDGTSRLAWFDSAGRNAWTAAVDSGDGLRERAARAFLAAGRTDEARAAAARALGAGAQNEARTVWSQTGGGAVPGLDPSVSSLTARTWFPPVPDVEIRLLDGGAFKTSSARGKVLLLDFWASWCAPCLQELPKVQSLHATERGRGFEVVTVNARESVEAARVAVRALGLTLPVGFYDDGVDRAFNVRALPTLILVDRDGRVRARWDNYVPDFEGEVASKILSLLGGDPEGAPREVAQVLAGGDALRVRWLREMATSVAGIAVVGGGGRRIATTVGDVVVLLEADGRITARRKLPPTSGGSLRSVEPSAGTTFDLVDFRPGRNDVVWLSTGDGTSRVWNAPGPVLDVAAVPAGFHDASGPRVALATAKGAVVAGSDGPLPGWGEPGDETCGVAAAGTGADVRIVTATRAGELRWHALTGELLERLPAPVPGCGLVAGDDGQVGLLPPAARGAARGRFTRGERPQVAVASSADQLVIADVLTGEIKFRAKWPGIRDLAAGDLDGDGREELVVVSGRSVVLLGK